MKSIILIISFLFPIVSFATSPDDIIGVWLTENDESKVEIYKVGNEYYGKIIWLKEPNDNNGYPKKDINNPSPSKRNNPAIGIMILTKLKYENGKWKGTIYGPKRGKKAGCILELQNINTLSGTVTYGLITGSKIWKRVK